MIDIFFFNDMQGAALLKETEVDDDKDGTETSIKKEKTGYPLVNFRTLLYLGLLPPTSLAG